MKAKRIFTGGVFTILGVVSFVSAQEPVYYDVVQKIMDFEFENSDVMENASWICDVFGPRKDYHNFVAYFDQDIGPGRIRGVSIMGNEEIRAIFTEWIKPLHGLGMSHLFTSGLYHEAYAEVGLPGFYFMHDRNEIDDWNAHTSMDVYERLFPEGLMQTAVVVATLAYHAAMRDEKLPRIAPLPW